MPGFFRRQFRAHPWRSGAVLVALFFVGAYGATHGGPGQPLERPPREALPPSSTALRLSNVTNNMPQDLVVHIATPIDYEAVLAPARSENELASTLPCPSEPFELQLSAWAWDGKDWNELVRDERIPSYRCPDGPQMVTVHDEGTHVRLSIAPDEFA